MSELLLHIADFAEGYRITSTGDGLLIETTDHHPFALKLSREALAKFKLRLEDDHYIPLNAERDTTRILEGILASLNRAIELLGDQGAERKLDITNLRRAMILLGGLDEEVAERILREEGT
jgi:hypothetical protein